MSAVPSPRADPTIAALHSRADAIVAELLHENERRWVALAERDRMRVDALAHTIAHRLLREPTLRLERDGGNGYAEALRELFALDG